MVLETSSKEDRHLNSLQGGIILLQETHCNQTLERRWLNEWGGQGLFANGSTSSKGVAILFSKKLKFKITEKRLDPDGRMIIVTIIIEPDALSFTLVNVYAPTQSHPHQQTSNLSTLESKINKFNLDHLIVVGDFNLHLDPILDCVNVKPSNN